ncbi:Ribosomal RNA-processing protein 7, partial [Ascosphaera pollenicola]
MAPSPQTIGEFSVLPISIPPVPSFPRNVVHYLYVRRNAPKIPTANDSRKLHLRALFASLVGAGRFESASFEDERKEAEAIAAALDAAPAQA